MHILKSRWMAVISALTVLSIPSVATANDPGLCFMVTSSGQKMNLGQLCKVTPTKETVWRIPIKRRIAKTPIVDVIFNGNQVFEMVFDTGASGILITQRMATILKPKPMGIIKVSIADGSIVEFPTGIISSVGVGSLVVKNPQIAVARKAEIGLLGHDFFEKYDIKIMDKYIEFHQR
ncbi:MAG: TIGR02281 family clan AA aspartic protease [Cuspidothrix sp.]